MLLGRFPEYLRLLKERCIHVVAYTIMLIFKLLERFEEDAVDLSLQRLLGEWREVGLRVITLAIFAVVFLDTGDLPLVLFLALHGESAHSSLVFALAAKRLHLGAVRVKSIAGSGRATQALATVDAEPVS